MENTMILSERKVEAASHFEIWKKFGNKAGKLQFMYDCETIEEVREKAQTVPMKPNDVLHIIERKVLSYISIAKK